ncbi:MAG TPA: hypothetical protein VFH70_12920 [Acidimicrobiales bacterium]|nr:hypothetical protein [Acidimicrobiales bacterium]
MTDIVLGPDERAVRAHLDSGAFLAGVAAGHWSVVGVEWPYVTVMMSAAPREAAPAGYAVRFELNGYPTIVPTGCIWDITRNEPLAAALRPKGAEVGMLFRVDGWAAAPNAMYAPWDRLAIADHANWLTDAPHLAWHAGRTLTFILNELHRILHADAYLGI